VPRSNRPSLVSGFLKLAGGNKRGSRLHHTLLTSNRPG
jgi:hypothetical protein